MLAHILFFLPCYKSKLVPMSIKAATKNAACLQNSTTANWLRSNATCKNTSFRKLVSVQNCSLWLVGFFSSLLSLQSLCLHSNAKTPSSGILSQHIATFFFGRLSSIVSTPHTAALTQSLSGEMGRFNFLQSKGLNSYEIRMAGLSCWKEFSCAAMYWIL